MVQPYSDKCNRHYRPVIRSRLPLALQHARTMLRTSAPGAPIDVFFVESRDGMNALVGARVTGFAHQQARAVFLVTNPSWRAFERHELMHIVAYHAWGPPRKAATGSSKA